MNNFYRISLLALFTAASGFAQAQKSVKDTLNLDSVIIKEGRSKHLPNVQGTYIFAGKKTFVTYPDAGKANLANNTARMVLAKIPGFNVWEMDGPVCN